jgi:hypothetical protein
MQADEELQAPLIMASDKVPQSTGSCRWRIGMVLATLVSSCLLFQAVFHSCNVGRGSRHGHVMYQATLKPSQQIEYTREFTAPCDYGILVFNIGPAANYLPYKYDIYQDAYVFSNNKKMCWAYPSYRGIQKGPFPWWVQGDPTSFDVPTGLTPTRISSRVFRPIGSKNVTTPKGGDFLIMAHGKFYTPAFYKNLKATINSWRDEDDDDDIDFGSVFENLDVVEMEAGEAGQLEIVP